MTEYDFSPEAIDAYVKKQTKISNWVDNTNRHPPANPFTPATPAVRAHHIKQEEDERRHRRRDSKDSRYHDRDREDRVRDRFVDVDASRHHRSTSPKSAKTNRNRSASYSATTTVQPGPAKGRNLPPPLPLGLYPNGYMSTSKQSSPTGMYPYTWAPQKLSPRDSKHSSRTSSSTWLPAASNMHLQQNVPHSAPVVPRNVVRSQTTPAYGHQIHPAYRNGSMGYLPNAPQLPYSHYQPKPQPLLKRLFMNWGGGNKPKTPRRKRSSSF
jgi:hypothetical protein